MEFTYIDVALRWLLVA